MEYSYVIIVTLAFAATVVAQQQINICDGVNNYMFLTDINNCTRYFICVNGNPIIQDCENGTSFNAKTQACEYSKTHCLQCDPNKLSLHPMHKTCNKYVLCFAGTPILQQCCDDLQFNTVAGVCDVPQNVDCVENQCVIQNNAQNITYIPSQAACDKYYVCMSGTPWPQTCAKGLQFSTGCQCCDLASNVKCTIKPAKRTLNSSFKAPPQVANISCPKDGVHFYPHAHSSQYYVCSNGKGTILNCADGLFYDVDAKSCRQLKNILQH